MNNKNNNNSDNSTSDEKEEESNFKEIEEMTLEIYEPYPMTMDITPIRYQIDVEDVEDVEEAEFCVEWDGGTQTCGASQIVYLQNMVPLTRGRLLDDTNGYFEDANNFVEVGNIIAEWFNLPPP